MNLNCALAQIKLARDHFVAHALAQRFDDCRLTLCEEVDVIALSHGGAHRSGASRIHERTGRRKSAARCDETNNGNGNIKSHAGRNVALGTALERMRHPLQIVCAGKDNDWGGERAECRNVTELRRKLALTLPFRCAENDDGRLLAKPAQLLDTLNSRNPEIRKRLK